MDSLLPGKGWRLPALFAGTCGSGERAGARLHAPSCDVESSPVLHLNAARGYLEKPAELIHVRLAGGEGLKVLRDYGYNK